MIGTCLLSTLVVASFYKLKTCLSNSVRKLPHDQNERVNLQNQIRLTKMSSYDVPIDDKF